MKKIQTVLWAVICFAIISLTSCLGESDDNNQIDGKQIATAMNELQGTYTGILRYQSVDLGSKMDTVPGITWTIDSVLTIRNFPVSVFANSFQPYSDKKLVESVRVLPSQEVICHLGFWKITDEAYQLNVAPNIIPLKTTEKETENWRVAFYNGTNYSLGLYNISKKSLVFNMHLYGLLTSNDLTNSGLLTPTFFQLVSEKKIK